MQANTAHYWHVTIAYAEKILAGIVILGVVLYAFGSARSMIAMDWSNNESFYQFIYRVLLLIIGLELARMLVTHSISAVLELLAFVIARKMLKPDLSSLDIILSVLAFVALAGARRYFVSSENDTMTQEKAVNT